MMASAHEDENEFLEDVLLHLDGAQSALRLDPPHLPTVTFHLKAVVDLVETRRRLLIVFGEPDVDMGEEDID